MDKCYYEDFGACTFKYSACYRNQCEGKGSCKYYVSENEYFLGMMNGTLKEDVPKEDAREHQRRVESLLRPEKTKKQQKYEERKAAEKEKQEKENASTGGFSLADDPVFKAFLEKNNKK